MKHRTGRKLLGVLLTLAMIVGMMLWMGLTALADDDVIQVGDKYKIGDTINFGDDEYSYIQGNDDPVVGELTLTYSGYGGGEHNFYLDGDWGADIYIENDDSSEPWGIEVTGGDGTQASPWVFTVVFPERYPLWVGGVQVTSSNMDGVLGDESVRFTPAKDGKPAILKTNNAFIEGVYEVSGNRFGIYYNSETDPLEIYIENLTEIDNGIYSETTDITISGNNTLEIQDNNTDGSGICAKSGSVNILGCEITTSGSDSGIYAGKDINIMGGTVITSGKYGVHSMAGDVKIQNSKVTVIGTERGIEAANNVTVAKGMVVKAGEDESSAVTVSDTSTWTHSEKWVKAESVFYPLWVGGIQVTSSNNDNVFAGDPINDNKVSFTPAEGENPATLTFRGVNITNGYDDVGEKYGIYWNDSSPLSIVLASDTENKFELQAEKEVALIRSSGNISISGTGSISAINGLIRANGQHGVTIENGTVNVAGIDAGALAIKGGVVNASTGKETSTIEASDITIEGGISNICQEFGGTAHRGINTSTMKISGGEVNVTSAGNGIAGEIEITGGKLVIVAFFANPSGTVINQIPGTGWTDTEGTEGETAIAVSENVQSLSGYRKILFASTIAVVESVTLAPSTAQTIDVGGKVSFTATVNPADATDKKVKWSVGGTNSGAVKLYTDADCTTEVGADATETLTVYAKGISAGSATVTATSNADSEKKASCEVTVTDPLADAKTSAKADLDTLLTEKNQNDYDAADWTTLTQAITDGKTAIDNATTTEAVTTAKNNAVDAVNAVKTKAQKELDNAKTTAKNDLDTLLTEKNQNDYDAADWTTLTQAITDGKTAIDNATTTEAVATAKNTAVDAVNAVKTKAQKLADAKTTAKNDLDTLLGTKTESDYDAADWTTLTQAIANGKTAIENATTTDAVATAKNTAVDAVNAVKTKTQKLADAKTEAKNDLDTLKNSKTESDYDAADWTTLTQAITDGKTAIDNATTSDAVTTAKNNAVDAVNAVKTKAQKALDDAKASAANTVNAVNANDYIAADQQTVTNAKTTALAAIEAATTEAEVNTALETFNTAIANCVKQATADQIAQVMSEVSAKTGSDMTYTGNSLQLINTPTTALPAGYTMKYAVTTENTKPTDENLYTTSIPTATDAGTYYVWYKVKGDDNHVDSAVCAAPVTVTIAPANKDVLNTAITEAETYYNTIKDNADYAAIASTLKSAIDAAKEVADNDNATEEQVSAAANSATNAKKTAEDAVKAAEKKAADEAAAKAVTDAFDALPESAGVNDKAKVEAARKAYDALTEDQKKLVSGDELKKLTDAEASVQAAEEAAKKAADEAAAKAVTDAINALPESAGIGDKAAVEAARAAYDALTEDQKKLVPEDALAKLTAAEQQVREAEEAAKTIDIAKCKITVKNQTYTGKALKPAVTVKRGKVTLKKGTDYTVTYKNNVKIGLATATVKGKGKYVGTRKVTFKIKPKGTAFTKLTGGNRRIALKWKNPKKITGYRIQYSRKKDFSIRTTVTIEKAKTLTATFKRLAANKTYYVRIRTYTTVNRKNYYSAWSKTVAVKTKSANAGNGPDGQDAEAAVADEETLPLDEETLLLDEELDGALPPEEVIVLPEEILEDDILLNLAE